MFNCVKLAAAKRFLVDRSHRCILLLSASSCGARYTRLRDLNTKRAQDFGSTLLVIFVARAWHTLFQ